MLPGSARNWIAVNAVQQSNLNKKIKTKNVTTLPLRQLISRSPLGLGFLLVSLALGCLAFSLPSVGRSDKSVGAPLDNGAQTVHFTAAYQSNIGGFFTCAGERITKTAPKPFTKDSEDCTMTDLSTWPPGTYVGDPVFVVNGARYIWGSDYDGTLANLVTIIVTDNGDGTGHFALVASY
jgi:hypothetical protein